MRNTIDGFTYPIVYEIQLDTLHFLHESGESKRFKEIVVWLLSQEKYETKYPNTSGIKPLLSKALRNLEKEGVLQRTRKSHKFVSYDIKNKKKARLLLKLRHGELFHLDKQTNKLLYKDTALNDLHWRFTFDFSLLLLEYERLLCEAKTTDDMSSFIHFEKGFKSSLLALLDTLIVYLRQRSKMEIQNFYTENLADTDSSALPVVFRREKATIVELGSWINAWKANHHAEVRFCSYLLNSFQECLSRVERHLRFRRSMTEEQITKNALKGLEILKTRKLSKEEFDVILKESRQQDDIRK